MQKNESVTSNEVGWCLSWTLLLNAIKQKNQQNIKINVSAFYPIFAFVTATFKQSATEDFMEHVQSIVRNKTSTGIPIHVTRYRDQWI